MKAAVVGAGRMGRRHVQVARNLGLELVGVADVSAESLAQAKQEAGLLDGVLYSDAGLMLREQRPECVVVATTAPSHAQYTLEAVEVGARFVLCEKPLSVSISDCDRMINACRARGVKLAVNHQMRFMEQYTEPRRLLNLPEFGGLSSITVVAGNFGLAMNGTHYLEMFRFMTGEAPVSVSAWFSDERVPNPRGAEFEDRAGSIRLATGSGKRFFMDAGSDQGHGVQVTYAARYGVVWVDELAGQMRMVSRKPEHRSLPTTRYGMPWEEVRAAIPPADVIKPSEAVLRALLAGRDYPSGEDGRLAVAGLVAAYVSHERGGVPVRLDAADLTVTRTFPWA